LFFEFTANSNWQQFYSYNLFLGMICYTDPQFHNDQVAVLVLLRECTSEQFNLICDYIPLFSTMSESISTKRFSVSRNNEHYSPSGC